MAAPPDPAAPPRPWRRRRRRTALVLLAVILVAWCLGDGSPVGHFASAADKDRFLATYARDCPNRGCTSLGSRSAAGRR